MRRLRRFAGALGDAVLLSLLSGVVWYAWSAQELGRTCHARYNGLTDTLLICLVLAPAAVVARRQARLDPRSRLAMAGYSALAAVMAAVAIYIAAVIYVLSEGRCLTF